MVTPAARGRRMSRKQTLYSIVSLLILLLVLLTLGLGQQRVARQQSELTVASEKLLFQYAILREHLIESILTGQYANLAPMAGEMENLRQNLTKLVSGAELETGSQLSFLNQVDLSGLILLLREKAGGGANQEKLRQLQQETRILGERLLLLDRMLGERARRSLVALQAVIIGILALAVCALVAGLLLFSRRLGREKPVPRTGQPDLFRASQMAALGELTGEVAHEINDLSNGVINYAQLLADELADCGTRVEAEKMLGQIIGAGERIGTIAAEILACSESRDQGRQSLELSRVVADVLALLKNRFRRQGILVVRDLPSDLPAIIGNRRQLQQLFVNLLLNAQQALDRRYPVPDENKRLTVDIEPVADENGEWLRIVIIDYGCGMSPEILKRVVEPEFPGTGGPGRGLGLLVCREIVVEHGGRLEITSQPGDHTRVAIDLPRSVGSTDNH
jgi:signal transduction histidine kinase